MTILKRQETPGRDELEDIIELCRSVENSGSNPFNVNVEDLLVVIKKYFPNWQNLEDLCLDAKTLNQITSIIRMQAEWIKRRTSSLYRDPFLVEEKLKNLPLTKIAEIFQRCWNLLVYMDQLSIGNLEAALKYWKSLSPIDERWPNQKVSPKKSGLITREELVNQGILLDTDFTSELETLWKKLKAVAGQNQKIEYWDFVGQASFEATLKRAYLTSFLVTYGYAKLEVDPLKEEIYLKPHKEPVSTTSLESFSFPIPINMEEWEQRLEDKSV